MNKIYQPIVLEQVENLIEGLKLSKFFEEYEINDLKFTRNHLSVILTEKFIEGKIDDPENMFTEDEFDKLLRDLVVGSLLYELKDKGYVNSYDDEGSEEIFFLTEDGKKHLKKEK